MSKGKVWITRAAGGAAKSAESWRGAGFETVIAPVIEIAPPVKCPPPLPKGAALIVTSQNALRYLSVYTDKRDWPVIAVGSATARLARQMGFEDVSASDGNARDLEKYITGAFAPDDSPAFIHACGANIRLNVAAELRKKGYKAQRHIYYFNKPVQKLPALDLSEISHIALYSPMAAKTVSRRALQYGRAMAVSISPATDKMLSSKFRGARKIAVRPAERFMIEAVSS